MKVHPKWRTERFKWRIMQAQRWSLSSEQPYRSLISRICHWADILFTQGAQRGTFHFSFPPCLRWYHCSVHLMAESPYPGNSGIGPAADATASTSRNFASSLQYTSAPYRASLLNYKLDFFSRVYPGKWKQRRWQWKKRYELELARCPARDGTRSLARIKSNHKAAGSQGLTLKIVVILSKSIADYIENFQSVAFFARSPATFPSFSCYCIHLQTFKLLIESPIRTCTSSLAIVDGLMSSTAAICKAIN